MRIIAKNHDYYDSALAFGHDEHVVFARKEEEYVGDWEKELSTDYSFMAPNIGARQMAYHFVHGHRVGGYDSNRRGREFAYYPFTVAFCGKLYPGIRIESRQGYMGSWSEEYAYTFEAYASLLNNFGIDFMEPKRRKYWSTYDGSLGSPRSEEHCKKYFEGSGEDHVTFFADRGQPIVVYRRDADHTRLQINCELKKLSFFKVFDAYTAFQELDMFISGVMTRDGNPMAGISDTDLRDKKGFDDKSFKKPPTKKKR